MTLERIDAPPSAAALADAIDALVQCASPSGRLLFANRAWRDRLGYAADDIPALGTGDVVAGAYRDGYDRHLRNLLDGGQVGAIRTQLVTREGRAVDVEGSLTRVVLNGGSLGALGVFVARPPAPTAPFTVPAAHPVALTPRQRAVLQLFASGHTTKQVSVRLDIAVKTVHNHLTAIYRALDAQSLVQATMIAAQLGLVDAPVTR